MAERTSSIVSRLGLGFPPSVQIECVAMLRVVTESDSPADHDLGGFRMIFQEVQQFLGKWMEIGRSLRCHVKAGVKAI
jgi:hypothetical protein